MRSPSILPTLHAPNPTGNLKLEVKHARKKARLAPEQHAQELQHAREAHMMEHEQLREQHDKDAAADAAVLREEEQQETDEHPLQTMHNAASVSGERELVIQHVQSEIKDKRLEEERSRQAKVLGLKLERDTQLANEPGHKDISMRPPLPRKAKHGYKVGQASSSTSGNSLFQVAPGKPAARPQETRWTKPKAWSSNAKAKALWSRGAAHRG
jgi:hypothetical protein